LHLNDWVDDGRQNPLDMLIRNLGGESKVAEMTGRTKRFEQGPGGLTYTRRQINNVEERGHFQDGRKLVAIISQGECQFMRVQLRCRTHASANARTLTRIHAQLLRLAFPSTRTSASRIRGPGCSLPFSFPGRQILSFSNWAEPTGCDHVLPCLHGHGS
jgi:hypothetical protein